MIMSDSLERRRERRMMEARLKVLEDEIGAVRGIGKQQATVPAYRTSHPTGGPSPRHVIAARLAILEHEARVIAEGR